MSYSNGRLPQSALAPITRAVNGEQAYLEKHAAAAFMAMNAESEAKYGVTIRVASARVAYRTYAEQVYFWNLYKSGRGALAAYPGTSNHGWGLAVDLATPQMRSIVDSIGAKYGWAKKWSDAPSEWWHIKYRAGIWNGHVVEPLEPTISTSHHPVKAVKRLKKFLRNAGYWTDKTGNFGKSTRRAVRLFQKEQGLSVDGVVGPHTWSLLHHPLPPLKKGTHNGSAVKALKRLLRAQGYKAIDFSGNYGLGTRRAVNSWKKKHHLKTDSITGKSVWRSLRKKYK